MTRPSNLTEILADSGFVISEQPPCMLLYVDGFKGNKYSIDQYAISGVTKMEELKSWLDIINKALFEGELVTADQFGDVLRLDNTSFYLGFAEGRPVSACMTISGIWGQGHLLRVVNPMMEFCHLPERCIVEQMAFLFARKAWDAISRYIYSALQGGAIMHGWMNDDKVIIACCNDGTRPVIFKIERIDIEN